MTREEAIQHFKEQLDIFGGEHAEAIKVAIEALQADIVRCKDCKHAYYADNRVPQERTWVCERFTNEEINANDFCSFGERSEE